MQPLVSPVPKGAICVCVAGNPAVGILLNQRKPVCTKIQCPFWKQKQPLPLPSLTLLQGAIEKSFYFCLFLLSCGLEKECRPSTLYGSALLSVALMGKETWY